MMKRNKVLSWIVALCMTLSLYVSLLPVAPAEAGTYSGKIVLLYTANVRGDIDLYPAIAQAKANYASEGADVILVDAGNFLQGTQYSAYHNGESIVPLLDEAGYDEVALGTHDFDFGNGDVGSPWHPSDYENYPSLGDMFGSTSTTVKAVAANISGTNDTLSDYYANRTVTKGGLGVGIFGLTDANTVNQVNEDNLSGLTFSSSYSSIADDQVYDELAGCDITVCLANAPSVSSDATVTIDVGSGDGFTCGAYAIDENSLAVAALSVTLPDSGTTYTTVAGDVSAVKSTVAADPNSIGVAHSTVMLDGLNADNRGGETNTGDLVTDALLWYAKSSGAVDTQVYDNSHILALYNGGNLRSFLNQGDVTYYDLRRVLPYPNKVAVVYMTGAQLKEQLEACSQGLPDMPYTSSRAALCASFMQASGINYTVDTTMAYDAGALYGSGPWYKAASIQRVTINSVNGQPFHATATYAVVTSDMNAAGMDAGYVFAAAPSTVTSENCYQAVMDYIQSQLGGTIGSAYATPAGQITIVP